MHICVYIYTYIYIYTNLDTCAYIYIVERVAAARGGL